MASGSYLISMSVEPDAVAKASGVFSIVGGIGGLVAPVIMSNSATFIMGADTASNQFAVAFGGMILFGIAAVILISLQTGKKQAKLPETGGENGK